MCIRDRDVTKHKDMGEEILQDFGKHKYDILLGTQMVSKGHDFKDVTAVGILTADSVLNIPVYSASERAFDLLTQTSGRAGRGDKVGSVVIQTYNPLNYAIIKSKAHDYLGFYNEEIVNRKDLGYPPFREMIYMVIRPVSYTHLAGYFVRYKARLLGFQDECNSIFPIYRREVF